MSIFDLFPLKVSHPIPFADINVGEVFSIGPERYRLLSRDAFSVRVLQWFTIYDVVLSLFGRKVAHVGKSI
jgi:hypothetical protein